MSLDPDGVVQVVYFSLVSVACLLILACFRHFYIRHAERQLQVGDSPAPQTGTETCEQDVPANGLADAVNVVVGARVDADAAQCAPLASACVVASTHSEKTAAQRQNPSVL